MTPSDGLAAQCADLTRSSFEALSGGAARVGRMEGVLASTYAELGTPIDLTASDVPALVRFCRDASLDDVPEPATAVTRAFDRFRSVVASRPDWRRTVASSRFGRFVDVRYGDAGRRALESPAAALLIDDFLRQEPRGVYRLTPEDLAVLTAPGGVTLYGVGPVPLGFADLPDSIRARVEDLRSRSYQTVDSVHEAIAVALASPGAPPEPTPSGPPPSLQDAALPVAPGPTTQSVSRGPDVLADLRRALVVEERDPVPQDTGPELSADLILGLEALAGRWFSDRALFKTAVRVSTGLSGEQRAQLERVLAVAREERPTRFADSVAVQPLAWEAEPCGCGAYERGDPHEPELYGLFPVWHTPQGLGPDSALTPPVTIDFSVLTRVGYYGVTFDANGRIVEPRHWQTERFPPRALPFRARRFSDFVERAHHYEVKADLVVYNDDWSPWLAGDDVRESVGSTFDDLADEILAQLTPSLPYLLDRAKPIVTLGQSPRRTLGDGVTLHFDFDGVAPEHQDTLFSVLADTTGGGFFARLDDRLEERDGVDHPWLFHLDQDYRLNLIVPWRCLAELPQRPGDSATDGPSEHSGVGSGPLDGCAFYSVERLAELGRWVDLFLVDLAARPGDPDLTAAARIDLLRAGLERLPVVQQVALMHKVIPLVAPGRVTGLDDFLGVTELSFRGVGSWSLTGVEAFSEAVRDVFLPVPPLPEDLPILVDWVARPIVRLVRASETRVCNWMCPHRWIVRLSLFLAVGGLVVFWLWTEVAVDLKRFYHTRTFTVLVATALVFATGTLWCDPYWKEHKGLIITALALAGLVFFLSVRARLSRERDYP